MRIITISREFGSGGRELGKRLAEKLGIAYYDREIISSIAEKNQLDEKYVEATLNRGIINSIPLTFGRTFMYLPTVPLDAPQLLVEQHKLIKKLATQGDCVIIGRNADIVLGDYKPLKLFVYAGMESKVKRCRQREFEGQELNFRELEKKIKEVDKVRANYHEMISNSVWGDKRAYHLCINTTDLEIKALVPVIADYVDYWFGK